MSEAIQKFLAIVNAGKWWAVGAAMIYIVVRATKPDVRWAPTLDPRWRPLLAALCGVALSGFYKVLSGESADAALKWGLSAAAAAVLAHVFGIEVARGGKDVPMIGSIPPPPSSKK